MFREFLSILLFLCIQNQSYAVRNKCYSCASTNMKENFINKQRGPPNRMSEPRTFDNHCNGDTWIIKERSTDECDGPCFKWQQSLNNSGSFTTMTFRGCYSKFYNMMDPNTIRPPNHSFCTVGEVPLSCLSDASIIEYSCWCDGDYCNSSSKMFIITSLLFLISTILSL